MRFVVFLTLLAICSTTEGEEPKPESSVDSNPGAHINVSTILAAVGTPKCMRKCIGKLAHTAKKLLRFTDVIDDFHNLCSAHESADLCLENRSFCGQRKIYDVVTSSIGYACNEKRDTFRLVEPCLKPAINTILTNCDDKCHLRSNLSELSVNPSVQFAAKLGGNMLIVADHLQSFCSSARCILPCIREEVEKVCPLSGLLIADVLLQPFDAASRVYSSAQPILKEMIRQKMGSECIILIEPDTLAHLRKGI